MPEQTLSYEQYLSSLPPDRRDAVEQVWQVVRASMPAGYTEEVSPKFLTFKTGAEWYVALANQKNYISLYLIPLYVFPELKTKLDESGKKLKCGKSCINFKQAEDLPLEVIAEIVAANDAEAYIAHIRQVRDKCDAGK
jgi:uncharacterized protein YdhG (YjbR/CyaY superfamily)